MTKDVEVGDVFTGKVVKTTTFGAFVELTKGTDGLLHISNLVPGGRAETVEASSTAATRSTCGWSRSNKERGRIGLRLADDPEIEGKTVEELSTIGTGTAATAVRRPRTAAVVTATAVAVAETVADAAAGDGRDRGGSRRAPRLGPQRWRQEHTLTELDSGIRVVTERVPSVRSVALGLWVGVGSRDETTERGRHLALPRAHAVQGHAGADGRADRARPSTASAPSMNAATSKETTVLLRALPRRAPRRRVRGDGRTCCCARPIADLESEREVVLEEIAMYEDEPAGQGPRRALRRPSSATIRSAGR